MKLVSSGTRPFAVGLVGLGMLLAVLGVFGQAKNSKPVTDTMLLNPDPADWLNFRRTLDGWGYSPLKQINKQNVQQLQLAWSWTLRPGTSEPTPLVYDGVMYLPNPGGGVQALDAATGDLLWEFRVADSQAGYNATGAGEGGNRPVVLVPPIDPMRNLAIYGDKVYTATGRSQGAHVIALNARTGAVVWDKQVGFRHTAGPIAVKGKIIISTNGCERYKDDDPPCFIAALDAETGKELWRTSTIARPGEPGGDTWGDLPLAFRAGGDNWQAGTYDPATNLTYWGTAQAKPWVRAVRGTDGDALYTDSTLALNLDTGKIVWYFQNLPGDSTDHDETFERVLVNHDGRSSVFSMGKLGIMFENDRESGAFRSAHDLGYQDLVTVDQKTGRTSYRPGRIPEPGVPITMCPSAEGVKTWRAMSYNPETQAFYIPVNLNCQTLTYKSLPDSQRAVGRGGTGESVDRTDRFHPASPNALGEFLAMDIKTGNVLWRHRTRTPMMTSALTTAGGLAIIGDYDRYLYVHDAANGKVLFQTRLPNIVDGFPVTYAVNGRQYIAVSVSVGSGGGWATTALSLTPEVKRATNVNALFVFALPQAGAH